MPWFKVTAMHTELLEIEVKAEGPDDAIDEACRTWSVDGDLDHLEVEEVEE